MGDAAAGLQPPEREEQVVVEERIYTLQPMSSGAFLSLVEQEGYEVQSEHLGKPLGYFSTEFGPQNQIVHLWAYRDLQERAERRAALVADPRWQTFRPKLKPFLVSQENKLLLPARFAPVER